LLRMGRKTWKWTFYLFIYNLFNNVINFSEYIKTNGEIIKEWRFENNA
jgi:hypothetical protein